MPKPSQSPKQSSSLQRRVQAYLSPGCHRVLIGYSKAHKVSQSEAVSSIYAKWIRSLSPIEKQRYIEAAK